jgi:PIN domain nuclease of toxin-antitoxin system
VILLDTCTLLWLASAQAQLSQVAVNAISEQAGFLHVSAISALEIGIKQQKGRLTLPLPAEHYYATALTTHGIIELAIDGVTAARSTALPAIHADPADRILIATAQRRRLTILTPDPHIRAYPDTQTIW